MSPRWNWDSLASECAPHPRTGGGAPSPAGEGLGESQFPRRRNSLALCPTLCSEVTADFNHFYDCRWREEAGRLLVTPLQLAVLEKKREVVGSLLHGLTADQLLQAVTVKLIILGDKVGLGI